MRSRGLLLPGLAAALLLPPASSSAAVFTGELEFLGEALVASGMRHADTEVGGLSGIHYDPARDRYFAISDDPSATDSARIYELRIDLSSGALSSGDVEITDLLFLRDRDGRPFEKFTIDGEGIAPAGGAGFFISSEGNVERGAAPFIREIDGDGAWRRDLEIPRRYLPRRRGRSGIRHNLAFEGLALSPDGRWLFAGVESALAQDGPPADVDRASPARILRFDAESGRLRAEYLYWVDPVPLAPTSEDGFRVNGLVELLALDDDHLLVLERSYSAGAGNSIRLYAVDLSRADALGRRALGRRAKAVEAAAKTLLVDFADLGIRLENVEGLTLGPELPDGRRSLVLVSDNNFSPRQRTQLLAFAWQPEPPTIPEIQGSAHRSPRAGRWTFGVRGVVTAVDPDPQRGGFWLQDPRGDARAETSDALFVALARSRVAPGDEVVTGGRVVERGARGALSVTAVAATTARILQRRAELPSPVAVGTGTIPALVDDDGMSVFDPALDALDFFESLEGMRVSVPDPLVVGPTSRFGDFVVVASAGEGLERRTRRRGLLVDDDDPRPQRIQVDTRLLSRSADFSVGTQFEGSLVGVLDYSYGFYELVLTEPPAVAVAPAVGEDPTDLTATATALTIATYNVENLDAGDSDEKFGRVAEVIVSQLGSPDIVALQEIQDDSGREDDGVVAAARTLGRLIAEIVRRGGPRYAFHQVDPEDGADGGQPGANIRVAYLVDPARIGVPLRGRPDAVTAVDLETTESGPKLVPNPGRIAPADPAFAFDEAGGFEASRKPLALEVEFGGRRLFLVNLHLKSKRGDDGLFGSVQPPGRGSEAQRRRQARIVHELVARILLADPQAAVVVLGDLNEHEFRPPLADLAGHLLVNLMSEVDQDERYTYVYRGLSQVLDHVLVSKALAASAMPEVDVVHVHADSPASVRTSDHDPVIVRLDLLSSSDR